MPPLIHRQVLEGAEPGPRLLVTAGVHGDEFEPMVAVSRLADTFDAKRLRGRLTLIPIANRSAYARASRTGEDDLDLARTFPGKSTGSITERVAAALKDEIRAADYYIDLHTGGTRLDVLPLVGYMLTKDENVLGWQRRMAEAFNLPIVWGTSAELEGRSLSAARDAGVPAIYAEHGGGGGFRADAVEDYMVGCEQVMVELGMIDAERAPRRVRHRVEDRRNNSGYLQICHPAPADGLFLPQVRLSDRVQVGQPIGLVMNPDDKERHSVLAEQSGLVITLHTFPQVQRGTGLCVVLEIPPSTGKPYE